MARHRKPTSDAVAILHRRYFEGRPGMLALLQQARLNADIAQKVYDLRTEAGLTQRELADRVGTTASVICRLEDADYVGHSLTMLQRIAAAVDKQVQVNFVRLRQARTIPEGQSRKGRRPAVRPARGH
jgi:DNA-binding XRE family transcriptional regulator